jgi:hypothetical protein
MRYVNDYKYNIVTLNTSEGRGLSIIQKPWNQLFVVQSRVVRT